VTAKEFYVSPSMSSKSKQKAISNIITIVFVLDTNITQTYDNQPAIYKYSESLKHPAIIYDMERSPRNQTIKSNDNEQICPQLIFESRFEGGNLRQVRRV
jgi:hypothetical protein